MLRASAAFLGLVGVVAGFEPITVQWAADNKFEPTHRKHNWCSNATEVQRVKRFGSILQGSDVSVVLFGCRSPWCANETALLEVEWDEDLHQLTGGFFVKVWSEVARRAELNWNTTVAVSDLPDPDEGERWDQLYQWAADNYDVVVDPAVMMPSRSREQLRFAYPFMDVSMILIGVVNVALPEWYEVMFSFLRPFSADVWLAILLCFIVGAFGYRILEGGQNDVPPETFADGTSYATSLYLTTANFTAGGGAYQPQTMPGRLFTVGFNFALLLIVSAYTANLASMLVVQAQKNTPISSLEDAILQGVPICAVQGGAPERILREYYPALNVQWAKGYGEAYNRVLAGDCVAAVSTRFYWQASRGQSRKNPDCVLDVIGPPIRELQSSFIFRADDAVQCTAVIADYVTVVLQDMYVDGWLDSVTQELIQAVQDQTCPDNQQAEESQSLTLKDMSGIFIVQLLALVASLALDVGLKARRRGVKHALLDESDEGSCSASEL